MTKDTLRYSGGVGRCVLVWYPGEANKTVGCAVFYGVNELLPCRINLSLVSTNIGDFDVSCVLIKVIDSVVFAAYFIG